MSTLIYIPAGLQTPELEILIAKVQNSIDAGENTIVATCELCRMKIMRYVRSLRRVSTAKLSLGTTGYSPSA